MIKWSDMNFPPINLYSAPHWSRTMTNTPETIYLIHGEDGLVWCDDPAPDEHCDLSEAVKYVRADVHQAIIDRQAKAAPQPEGDEWIKCSDRLPTEDDGYVWIFYPGSGVGDKILQWDDEIGEHAETHWMPTGLKRPQPPKQEPKP